MEKHPKKCVNCNNAIYKSAKLVIGEKAKRDEICLYCPIKSKLIEPDELCDNWKPVKGDLW